MCVIQQHDPTRSHTIPHELPRRSCSPTARPHTNYHDVPAQENPLPQTASWWLCGGCAMASRWRYYPVAWATATQELSRFRDTTRSQGTLNSVSFPKVYPFVHSGLNLSSLSDSQDVARDTISVISHDISGRVFTKASV